MRYAETIIIGGGPAGSSCGWKLKRAGKDVLILDKAEFPRLKLCAGWITSKVMADLQFSINEYPHGLLGLDASIHIPLFKRGFNYFPTRWKNYSIRRTEFDSWLLERSNVEAVLWSAREIAVCGNGEFLIDDEFRCKNLVGAGGTGCPVTKRFFKNSRTKKNRLVTLEKEFHFAARADTCHLFFGKHGLPGYSWFVPKADGYVNIGVGAIGHYLKKTSKNIHDHWALLIEDLIALDLIDRDTAESIKETGHPYYLNAYHGEVKTKNCFVIGDAAGLASMDMGEGIGPAIESALMTADEIIGGGSYSRDKVSRYSLRGILHTIISIAQRAGSLKSTQKST